MQSLFQRCLPRLAVANPASSTSRGKNSKKGNAGGRLPYILCAAPMLTSGPVSTSSSFPEGSPQLSAATVLSGFKGAFCADRSAAAALPKNAQKDLKRKGFHAVIQWCQLHQMAEASDDGSAVALQQLDSVALSWVHTFTPLLSCGQSLVLIGFLSDILCRISATSHGNKSESTINDAVRALGVLVHRVTGSDHLERQPLPAILSAVYGLQRITAPDSVLCLDEVTAASLQPPQALLFAMLANVRAGLTGGPASSTTASAGGGGKAPKDNTSDPVDVTVQVLLTFALVMTPKRVDELLSGGDVASFRSALNQLADRVRPLLASRSYLHKETKRLRKLWAQERDDASGHLDDDDAGDEDDHMPSGDAKAESGGCSQIPAEDETATAVIDAMAALEGDKGPLYLTVQECLAIMRNISISSPSIRLTLFQYLFCVLHPSSSLTSSDDTECLVKALSTLRDIPRRQRLTVTEYCVASLPAASSDVALLARLLPHVRFPSTYVACMHLDTSPETVTVLPVQHATALLRAGGASLQWPLMKTLVTAVLRDYPTLHDCVHSPSSEGSAGTTSLCPLTTEIVDVLSALLSKLSTPTAMKKDDNTPDHSRGKSDDAEVELAVADLEEIDEKRAWLVRIVQHVDWSGGITDGASDQTAGARSATANSGDSDLSSGVHRALPALEVYLYCAKEDLLSTEQRKHVTDKVLLNHYVRYAFATDEQFTMARKLRALSGAVELLASIDNQRRLVDRMIRYNGGESWSAAMRFLIFIAPLAIRLSVENTEATNLLLKQHSLDPAKAVSIRPGKGGGTFPLPGMNTPGFYYVCMKHGMEYIIQCRSMWKLQGKTEEMRQVMGRWVNRFFHSAAPLVASGHVESTSPDVASAASPSAAVEKEAVSAAEDEGGDVEHEEDADDTTYTGETAIQKKDITVADVDDILVLALRAGVRIPTSAVVDMAAKLRERVSHLPATLEEEEGYHSSTMRSSPEDTPDRHLFVQLAQTPAAAALLAAPVSSLPSPAQFVALIRGNCGFALPLSEEYLRALLRDCDTRIFAAVATTFVSSVTTNRHGPDASDDLLMTSAILEAFFERMEAAEDAERGDAFTLGNTPSEVLGSLIAFLIHHFLRGKRTFQQLIALVNTKNVAAVKEGGDVADDATATAEVGESAAPPPPGDAEDLVAARVLHSKVEGLFMQGISLLSREQVKEIALGKMENLSQCFPRVDAYLYLRVSHAIPEMAERDLLRLAARFPQSEEVVVKQLKKEDLKLTLDVSDFTRAAKRLPMGVNELLVSTHLPGMSFAWCTRLLSVLVSRHEEVPAQMLADILGRVEHLSDGASESDRNLVLMVLQGYLNFHTRAAAEGGADAAVEEALEEKPMLISPGDEEVHDRGSHRDNTQVHRKFTHKPLSAEEIKRRKSLVLATCDKLLQVESIIDLPTLQQFLTAYPTSLQSVTDAAVVQRADTVVLEPLLSGGSSGEPMNLVGVRLFAVMMLRRGLLRPSSAMLIKAAVFDDPDTISGLTKACVEGTLRSGPDGDPITKDALLAHCVELALLLGMTFGEGISNEVAVEAATPGGEDALVMTCRSFVTPAEHLSILSLVTEAVANARKGQHRGAGGSRVAADGKTLQQRHSSVIDSLCRSLLLSAETLSASEFSRLVQSISRLRRWDTVKAWLDSDAHAGRQFETNFRTALERADAHSRCVVIKAISSDKETFSRYERLAMQLARGDIAVLSPDDLEMLLVAAIQVTDRAELEQTLDAIATKLLGNIGQCKRSTLVRLLQCHATFRIHDEQLFDKVVAELQEQSMRAGSNELKLDVPQVLTVLQAAVALDLELPERFLVLCFGRLERMIEVLTYSQLAQTCGLAVDLGMGYSSSINTLVSRLLESREGQRQAKVYAPIVEAVCDAYDVESPQQLRLIRLRSRRERERLQDYWHRLAERRKHSQDL